MEGRKLPINTEAFARFLQTNNEAQSVIQNNRAYIVHCPQTATVTARNGDLTASLYK